MAVLAYSFVERTETCYEHTICVWAFTTSHSWKRFFFFSLKIKIKKKKRDILPLFSLFIKVPKDDVFRKYIRHHSKDLCIILQRQEIALKTPECHASFHLPRFIGSQAGLHVGIIWEVFFLKMPISGFPTQKVWLYGSGWGVGVNSFKSSPGDSGTFYNIREPLIEHSLVILKL